MLMRDYLILILLFGAVAGLGGLIVSDMSDPINGYGVNMTDPSFDGAYNQATYAQGLAEQMGNETGSSEGMDTLGGTELLFGSTKAVFQLVLGSFNMVRTTFVSMTSTFGIPLSIANILFGVVLSAIIITIVFVIISSLTKTKV